MDSVRLRRLKADHEALRRLANLHPKIEIEGVFGNPPERYRLRLKVMSLREHGETSRPQRSIARGHHAQGDPRDATLCRMLTPCSIRTSRRTRCASAKMERRRAIALLIQRVGEILAFQSYNQDPLNAARAVGGRAPRSHPGRSGGILRRSVAGASPAASLTTPACRTAERARSLTRAAPATTHATTARCAARPAAACSVSAAARRPRQCSASLAPIRRDRGVSLFHGTSVPTPTRWYGRGYVGRVRWQPPGSQAKQGTACP